MSQFVSTAGPARAEMPPAGRVWNWDRIYPYVSTLPALLVIALFTLYPVGYAISIEENEPGVCGIAAPIFDHLGHVVAAVNLGGTILQIKKDNMALLGETVARAAGEMSRRLGYTGQRP